MRIGEFVRGPSGAAVWLMVAVCAGCAGTGAPRHWVKAGADDAETATAIDDCRAQASAAQRREQGISQDIGATLGRNWELSRTTGLQTQTRQGQAAGVADQVFSSCMRQKGFRSS